MTQNISKLRQSISSVVDFLKSLLPKERAVRIWDITSYVQSQLNNMGTTNEYGDMMPAGYVMDAYIDDTGAFAIITKDDGKLYKIPVFIDEQSQITMGEEQEVYMEFSPVSRNRSLMVKRSADGVVRWFAMPACTSILNRSGEIDSKALFDSFCSYAERVNEYPELDFYHLGERLTLGKADMLFRDGVNFCATGTFYDTPIARAAIQSLEKEGDYWGLSIAYLPTKKPEKIRSTEGVEIPVFSDGICRFISLLPEDTAASILTSISTKEVNRMNQAQKDALKKLAGDDETLLEEMLENLKQNNRTAEQPGVVSRQQATPPATPAAAPVSEVRREVTEALTEALGEWVKGDGFKSAVSSIFTEMRAAETAVDDEEEGEEEPATETVEEARTKKTDALLVSMLAKLDELGKSREASVQELIDDLPSKVARAKLVRPRGSASLLPGALQSQERTNLDLTEIANQTLAKMGES